MTVRNFRFIEFRSKYLPDNAGALLQFQNLGSCLSAAYVESFFSQNGESLEGTYPEANDDSVDNYMNTIDPGKTVTVCQVFLLKDTTSDVTLQGKETLNVSGGQTTSF